ncbi:MAG: hypothetical protein U0P30_16430 [Vicinamibacterales bacterium]
MRAGRRDAAAMASIHSVIVALLRDECGQDLIEYALLTAAVGVAGIATWPTIATSIGTAYRALNLNTQGLWQPPPPGGGP